MSCQQCSRDELISLLSHQPRHVLKGMISISQPAKPSAVQRRASSSSIGFLDNLPVELLHSTLNILDFRSLSGVSRVSLRGKAVVESLPAYRDLMEFAPQTLKTLGQTGLISLHSSAVLHATLRSAWCVSCRKYGAFLFLPTCERCCYECLYKNQSLWVVPVALAGKWFNLTEGQLRKAPIMRSIPGVYSVGHKITRHRTLRLVSIKHAKELAIMIHGSLENMTELLTAGCAGETTEKVLKEYYTFKGLLEAPLSPFQRDPSRKPSTGNMPNDDYCGMASIQFPSLSPNNVLESGLWCRGCEWTFRRCRVGKLSSYVVSNLVPSGVNPFWVLQGSQDRARSVSEFLHHIKHCYGARRLVPGVVLMVENEMTLSYVSLQI